MSKALSMDLRERACKRLLAGETARVISSALGVSVATAVRWGQRLRATGHVNPARIGGYAQPKISGVWKIWLIIRINSADFTLRGLVAELAVRGLKVDYRTMHKFVHAEKLSFKKNCAAKRAGSVRRRTQTPALESTSA